MNNRRGFTLIEMIVVIAASGIVMSVGVWMLHMLMRSERAGAETLVSAAAYAGLSQQFRADVHAALSASTMGDQADGAGEELELTLPGGRRVTYRQAGDEVIREEFAQQQRIRQESYRIHRGARMRLELKAEQGGSWASLSWESDRSKTQTAADQVKQGRENPLKIEALLAKDHRYGGPPQ